MYETQNWWDLLGAAPALRVDGHKQPRSCHEKIKQPEQQLNLIVAYLSFAANFSQHVNVVLTL